MKKSSFVELEGRDKRRPIQYLDVKVTMESRGKNESVVELIEKVDISPFMNPSYDSIVLCKLLKELQLNNNIPLEGRTVGMKIGRSLTICQRGKSLLLAGYIRWVRKYLLISRK